MHPHNSNTDSNTNTDDIIIDKIVENDDDSDTDPDENDDDDYDDEIILVSSTRERWEKLHGIDPKNKKSKHDEENNINIGSRNNNGIIGLVHPDNGDEDDIMVVAVRPSPTRSRLNNASTNFLRDYNFQISFLFTGIAALSIWVMMTRRLPRKRKLGATTKGKLDNVNNATVVLSTRSTIKSEDNNTAADDNDVVTHGLYFGTSSRHGEAGSSESYSDDPSQNRQASPQIGSQIIAEVCGVSQPSPTMLSSPSSLSWNMKECNNGIIETQTQKTLQTQKKLEMARQVAQDIRLVQEVLVEHSLDPSLAPQLAMSLQSSQHIVESQRNMCYQTAMLDAHQRHLDRQLSEQQHRESLKGAQYDPNWNEKLQKTRDQCYYWNASNGGVSRLWWEVLLIQQLARGVIPVWQRYFYDYVHEHFHNGSSSSTHIGIGVHNNREIGLSTASFLKDTVASVLAQICDCESPGTSATRKGTESTTKTSWMISAIASHILSFNIDIGDAVSSLFLVLTSVLKQVLPAPIEYWTCYGYCIMLASTVLFFTIIFHQGLRLLSLPPFLHHVVNLTSMAFFYGLQRTLSLFFATLMRMVMVVPTTTMDYRDAGYHTSLVSDEQGQEQQQQNNRSSLIGCSFLLLSLWLFMPLLSWKRTSTLYHEAALRVTRADPVNFEVSFRNGTSQLKQWYRDQTAIRYLFLSMYSALIFWENSHNIK